MLFNRELFLDLCKRYQIPLNSTTRKCQIMKGGKAVDIDSDEIRQIICNLGVPSSYDIVLNGCSIQEFSKQYSLEYELLPAC